MTGADIKQSAPHWLTGAYRFGSMALLSVLTWLAIQIWTDVDKQRTGLEELKTRVSVVERVQVNQDQILTTGRAARIEFQSDVTEAQAKVGERLAKVEAGIEGLSKELGFVRADIGAIRTALEKRADIYSGPARLIAK